MCVQAIVKLFSHTYLLDPLIGEPGTAVLGFGQRSAGVSVQVKHRGAHLPPLGASRLSLLEQQGIVKL